MREIASINGIVSSIEFVETKQISENKKNSYTIYFLGVQNWFLMEEVNI